jgi:hypothetical protein
MLKNVYGAGKLISTVSTPKMTLVEQYMPGVVDQLINYQTQDVIKEVGREHVDVIYSTHWNLTSLYPLLNRKTGVVIAIAGVVPTSATLRSAFGATLPFWMAWLCDLAQLWYKWIFRGSNIKQVFVSGNPGIREDLEAAGEIIAGGKLKAVVTRVDFNDLDAIKRESIAIETLKGAVGKLIIRMV